MTSKDVTYPDLYQFQLLSNHTTIKHFVSGREGGVTTGEKGSLNLSYKVGDDPENVLENRKRVANAMGVSSDRLIIPVQTHSINVQRVISGKEELDDTDALLTNKPGICIAVMSADCVPVLLFDPENNACAAIHAGWKGTVGKIVVKTIQRLQKEFNTDPEKLIACIGPSICQQVYQVGPEVIAQVRRAFGDNHGLVKGINEEGKGYLNLWDANKLQLLSEGVNESNIEVAGICTYSNSDRFFSARKSNNNTGRFAAGIMIAP